MDRSLRYVFVILGCLSFILAVCFCFQVPWTLSFWPWANSSLPYTFLGAITAAIGGSLLWVGLSGEFGTLVGGAINLMLFYTGLGSSLFLLFLSNADQRLLAGALFCAIGALLSLGVFLWVRHYPLLDQRPTPRPVRISFGIFAAILLLVGSGVLLQIPNVYAWKLNEETSMLLGWFFIGACSYFLYGLLYPRWPNACGQLWSFLAYDLVLLGPFFLHFAVATPAQRPSLIINTIVLLYSAGLAIYYLLIQKETRVWRKSSSALSLSQ